MKQTWKYEGLMINLERQRLRLMLTWHPAESAQIIIVYRAFCVL